MASCLEQFLPDDEIRRLARTQYENRLKRFLKLTPEEKRANLLNIVKSVRKMKIAQDTEAVNEHSYEMPVSLLKSVFGSNLKFSCNYFKDDSMTIDEAEIAMMELYCERAQIKDGQRILDLGCGWGAVTLYIAQKYKNCHVMAITNSKTQIEFIKERIRELNLSNVKAILADVSTYEMEETFDRVLAIELLEHMLNYELFLRKISKWMTNDGLLFVHHVCDNIVYHSKATDGEDKASDFLFGSAPLLIPSDTMLLYFQDDLSVVDHWNLSGRHYARTCEEWLKRLDTNANSILNTPSGSMEEAKIFANYWRVYCITLIEGFLCGNNGEESGVCHLLFRKK